MMASTTQETAIEKAVRLIHSARHIVVLSGAGISTPSGIPDFRSQNTGLWEQDNPMVVASLTAFQRRPEVFFNWLRPLAEKMFESQPNPAHFALAALEQAGVITAVVTQNIDRLHQRAGSSQVIELHGNIETLTCPRCRKTYQEGSFRQAFIIEKKMPQCPGCMAILKPDIVLFEEMLPAQAWIDAQAHFEQADLIIVVGSSLEVSPAGQLPYYGLERGARLIINNFSSTMLDAQADALLPYDIAEIWPLIKAGVLSQSEKDSDQGA